MRENWAKCYQRDLVIHGSIMNNYVEAQFLILKDTILRQYVVVAI